MARRKRLGLFSHPIHPLSLWERAGVRVRDRQRSRPKLARVRRVSRHWSSPAPLPQGEGEEAYQAEAIVYRPLGGALKAMRAPSFPFWGGQAIGRAAGVG